MSDLEKTILCPIKNIKSRDRTIIEEKFWFNSFNPIYEGPNIVQLYENSEDQFQKSLLFFKPFSLNPLTRSEIAFKNTEFINKSTKSVGTDGTENRVFCGYNEIGKELWLDKILTMNSDPEYVIETFSNKEEFELAEKIYTKLLLKGLNVPPISRQIDSKDKNEIWTRYFKHTLAEYVFQNVAQKDKANIIMAMYTKMITDMASFNVTDVLDFNERQFADQTYVNDVKKKFETNIEDKFTLKFLRYFPSATVEDLANSRQLISSVNTAARTLTVGCGDVSPTNFYVEEISAEEKEKSIIQTNKRNFYLKLQGRELKSKESFDAKDPKVDSDDEEPDDFILALGHLVMELDAEQNFKTKRQDNGKDFYMHKTGEIFNKQDFWSTNKDFDYCSTESIVKEIIYALVQYTPAFNGNKIAVAGMNIPMFNKNFKGYESLENLNLSKPYVKHGLEVLAEHAGFDNVAHIRNHLIKTYLDTYKTLTGEDVSEVVDEFSDCMTPFLLIYEAGKVLDRQKSKANTFTQVINNALEFQYNLSAGLVALEAYEKKSINKKIHSLRNSIQEKYVEGYQKAFPNDILQASWDFVTAHAKVFSDDKIYDTFSSRTTQIQPDGFRHVMIHPELEKIYLQKNEALDKANVKMPTIDYF